MKKFIFLATMASQVMVAQAVITTNNQLADTNFLTDSAGVKVSVGGALISVGFFTENDIDITDLSAFTAVGSSVGLVADGYFNGDTAPDLAALGVASGKSVYIVAGNNTANVTSSTELLIFKTNETFSGTFPGGPSSALLGNGNGSLIIGKYGVHSFHNGTTDIGAFTMTAVTAIPEPSSLALLGLGATAFLFRRRK